MNEVMRILVVDDLKNWRRVLSTLLEREGYEVVTASSFLEAKRQIDSQPFHVAIIDMRLVDADVSDRSGILLLEYIHKSKLHIPNAIALTAYPVLSEAVRALKEYKVWDYAEKSSPISGGFDTKGFLETVRKAAENALSKIALASLSEAWHNIIDHLETATQDDFMDATHAIASHLARAISLSPPFLERSVSSELFVVCPLDTQPLFWATRLPPMIPLLFLKRRELTNMELDKLRYLIVGELKRFGNVAFLVLFCEEPAFASARELLRTKIRRPYAYHVMFSSASHVE